MFGAAKTTLKSRSAPAIVLFGSLVVFGDASNAIHRRGRSFPAKSISQKSLGLPSSSSRNALLQLRAGQSSDPNNYPNYDQGISYLQPQDESYADYGPLDEEPPYQGEAVQDRIDAWRREQMEKSLRPLNDLASRDSNKLLATVGKGNRVVMFFLMIVRILGHYENVNLQNSGAMRRMLSVLLMGLFAANLLGLASSFAPPSHGSKKRLKAIINLDKLLEIVVFTWCFMRLTLFPSATIPREVLVGSMLHSAFFFFQSQVFTRLNWDTTLETKPPDPSEIAQFYEPSQLGDETYYQRQATPVNNPYTPDTGGDGRQFF